LAYDSFTGVNNGSLEGQSSGTGWSQPWFVQNNDTTIPGYSTTDNSLTYMDLKAIQNKMSGGQSYLTLGRRLNTSSNGPFSSYVGNGQEVIGSEYGDTLWVSYLVNKVQNNDQNVIFDMHNSNLSWCNNCDNQHIAVGYFGNNYHVSGNRRWHLRLNNQYYDTGINLIVGNTYFMVLRVIFINGNTQVNLYVNPTELGNTMPTTPTLSQSTGQNSTIRSVAIYAGDNPNNGTLDEIRFASTYACVSPDAEIEVNLPPVANFVTSVVSGQAPLQVQMDGTSSLDPENSALIYSWNFGDGSPTIVSGPTVDHTFTALGAIPVSLTVTDNLGLMHTFFATITVLDQNNTYPCQTTITPIQSVSCGQTNGRIRVNAGINSFSLVNEQMVQQPIISGNEYHNLASGVYTLMVSGLTCTESFDIHMTVDSTSCSGWQTGQCYMDIGTNMSGFADWATERPLKNLFKHIRSNLVSYTAACFCWDSNVLAEMSFDQNGYPTQIPQTTSAGSTLVRYIISSDGGNLMTGNQYVLLWEGQGTISFGGAVSIQSNVAGRVVFTALDNGNIFINVTSSQLGNHIRDIRLLRISDEFSDLLNDPFYSVFKEKIAPFKVLRFMDWGNTNGNTNVEWSGRSTMSQFTYAGDKGVPYEAMIQLCNDTQKDAWICVPHGANDDYITQMATLFKDQLHSNLNIYLEYSNEIWNWIFPQAHYNDNNRPANLGYGRAMAQKAGNVFQLWHNVFGDERCRVKRVLGIQVGFNSLNEQILSQLPQKNWDFASPTHYFGLDHGSSGNPRLDILGGAATVSDIMTNALNSWNAFKPTVRRDYELIKLFGKRIITYEGGQHFVGNSFGIPYPYQQAMWNAQNTQLMYDMYVMMHDTIKAWGCELAINFSLASPQASVYGSWGVLEHIDVQPPYSSNARKYQAVIDNGLTDVCRTQISWTGAFDNRWSNPCNWDKSRLPDVQSQVVIPDYPLHDPQVDMHAMVRSVWLQANAVLTVLSGFTFRIVP